MEKLSIEEKAKRYDEAIEKFDVILNLNTVKESGTIFADDVRKILPELKESEDEAVWLTKYIQAEIDCLRYDIRDYKDSAKLDNLQRALSWLEKQREQVSPTTNESAWLHLVSDVLTWKDGIGQYLDDPRVQKIAKELCSEYAQKLYTSPVLSDSLNTGKNEQKDFNKVEPKFKIGDWITNGEYIWKIIEVKPLDYLLQSQDGHIVDDTISHVDEQFYSFTIEDAEDGEVNTEDLSDFEQSLKHIIEEAIEDGDTHNLKADADMLLRIAHKSI